MPCTRIWWFASRRGGGVPNSAGESGPRLNLGLGPALLLRLVLESECPANLDDARRMLGAGNSSKGSAAVDTRAGICELCVVPGIEEFTPKRELHLAKHRERFVSSDVPVV